MEDNIIHDKEMKVTLDKMFRVWRLNRQWTIGNLILEMKCLSDNPSRDSDTSTVSDIELGCERYLEQTERDHPERFAIANAQETNAEALVDILPEGLNVAEINKPVKFDWANATDEERKAYRVENLRKAREAKKLRQQQ